MSITIINPTARLGQICIVYLTWGTTQKIASQVTFVWQDLTCEQKRKVVGNSDLLSHPIQNLVSRVYGDTLTE